jgi:succinate-acetate transporter protein
VLAEKMSDIENIAGLNSTTNKEQQVEVVARVVTSGAGNEFVHIGNTKVYKHELIAAFGGAVNPGLRQGVSGTFANAVPLGQCAFATTAFVFSLVNLRARHVATPNVVVGLAFFYGGVVQLLTGMWAIVLGNAFAATALSSNAGFWLSYGAIAVDAFGIVSAYSDPHELESALGFYLISWFIFVFLLVLLCMRSTVTVFCEFAFLDLTFLLLACSNFTGNIGLTKAAGWTGVAVCFFAWYNAFSGLANKENSYIYVKPIYMPGAQRRIPVQVED